MPWQKSLSRKLRQRNHSRRTARSRPRRIHFEQFEDRRLLAIAVDDEYDALTNAMITGNVWTNDTYNWSWTNSNSESEYAGWNVVNYPQYGTFTDGVEGYFEYTPDPYAPADVDYFTYQICDDSGCGPGTVDIHLNAPPLTSEDTYVVSANSSLSVEAPGVLENDTEPNGETMTAAVVAAPTHGTLSLNSNGSFSYTPAANYTGWDLFTYRASDGAKTSDETSVWIKVNAPPVAAVDSYTTAQNEQLYWPVPSVLANDTDANADFLTAEVVFNSGPAHGNLTLSEDGYLNYTPNTGYSGSDSFTYRAYDGDDYSEPATVTITVIPLDTNLVASDDFYSSDAGRPVIAGGAGVRANDSAGTLTAIVVTPPAYGSLDLNANGSFTYTPYSPLFTLDTFTYRLTSGQAVSAPATVTIENLQHPEISLTRFYADGYNLQVQYAVLGDSIAPFSIAIYASSDGQTLDEPLEIVTADNTQGLHTRTIEPTFVDPERDYYLVAVVDSSDEVEEYSEDDNRALFLPGSFLVHEPSGKTVLHAHDGDDANIPMYAVRAYVNGGASRDWQFWTSQTVLAAPTTGTLYDFTGDGLVTALDAAAYTNYQQGNPTAWQRPGNRFDVNGDGYSAPSDVLVLINDYNAVGEHLFTSSPQGSDSLSDVTGDLVASVLDIQQLLDKLNGGSGSVVPASRGSAAPYSASATAILSYLAEGKLHYGDITIDEIHFRGHGGDDVMGAFDAPNWQFGGPGNDSIMGGQFDDQLYGGDGQDSIFGNSGNDMLDGGAHGDWLIGDLNDVEQPDGSFIPYSPAGDDILIGGLGNDSIQGNSGNDIIYGNDGTGVPLPPDPNVTDDDTIYGGDGDDDIAADDGDNFIYAGDGQNTISAGDGNNTIEGGDAGDLIFVGDGDNTISVGDGANTISVGDGSNTIEAGDGGNYIQVGNGDNVIDTGDGDDVFVTGTGDNDIVGGDGNDELNGLIEIPKIEIDVAGNAVEGESLSVIVWLSAPTDHDVTATLVVTGESGTSTSDRWSQSQKAVVIPAGQDYVTVTLPTVDNQLMDGSNLSTVALVNISGAELALDQPSPVTLWDNDEGMYLEWYINVGEDSDSAFYGEVRATTNGDGSLDADGVDNHGRSFHAHIIVDRTTWAQTIEMTIQGLQPEDDHWTGTTDNVEEVNGRFPMYSDSLIGSGMFAGLFAPMPQARTCGDGGEQTSLSRNDFGGSMLRPIGYHQKWNLFRLAEPAPNCGVIVIQKIIASATVTTTPGLPGSLPGGTKSFDPPVEYYEVLGRIPAGERVLEHVIDNWISPRANQPASGRLVNNVVINQDGYAVAYEDDAAAEAAVANWVVKQQDVIATIDDRELTITSGTFPSSNTIAPGLTVFAEEDAWHLLRFEFNLRPTRQSLIVDGKSKR